MTKSPDTSDPPYVIDGGHGKGYVTDMVLLIFKRLYSRNSVMSHSGNRQISTESER